jgi:FKBP-type peptidyl-prolyl cis-trans isomerase
MKTYFISFVVIFAIAIIGLTSYFLYVAKDADSEQPIVESSLQTQVTQNNSPLAVQGQATQQQAQLPTPQQFGQYEQYANNESPLILDIVEGTGPEVAPGDTVAMLYAGYLTNGQLFDATVPNEQNQITPFTFTIGSGQVIQGWELGIPGMKVGGQRRIIIPSQFGYGPAGQGSIPPDAMLIFDVELLDVTNEQP